MDYCDIDISNINLIRTKNTINYKKTNDNINYKKNYGIVNNDNVRLSFEVKNIKIPFGIEKYNKHQILNIIIEPQKYNEHYNIFVMFKNLDENFSNLEKKEFQKNIKINEDILSDIHNKIYYSNLKKNNDNYIIRTHILGTPNIYTIVNGKKFHVSMDNINNKIKSLKIEFGTFWITDTNYGILLYTKEIIV